MPKFHLTVNSVHGSLMYRKRIVNGIPLPLGGDTLEDAFRIATTVLQKITVVNPAVSTMVFNMNGHMVISTHSAYWSSRVRLLSAKRLCQLAIPIVGDTPRPHEPRIHDMLENSRAFSFAANGYTIDIK